MGATGAAWCGIPRRRRRGRGICIALCRRYPHLQAVGIDISQAMLAVAAEDAAREGFADRIQLREQSVVDVTDVAAFDMIWLRSRFCRNRCWNRR